MSGRNLRTYGTHSPALRGEALQKCVAARQTKLKKHCPVARHESRVAARTAFGTGGSKLGHRSLAGKNSFELRHGAQNLQREATLGRRGVDRIPQRPEMHAALVETADRLEKMQKGPAQTVETHDDKRVSGVQAVEKRGQDRPGRVAARGGFLGHRRTACSSERTKLRFQRLFARGDASISVQCAFPGHQATPALVEGPPPTPGWTRKPP